jgi:hypothetical protein
MSNEVKAALGLGLAGLLVFAAPEVIEIIVAALAAAA